MNINEKLALQQKTGGLVLFREGVFFRAYNESAYILTELLGHNLKIVPFQPAEQNKKWVFMCAFPRTKLTARLPNVVTTAYGGHLTGDFDLTQYSAWHQTGSRRAAQARATEAPRKKDAQASATRAAAPQPSDENVIDINLPLSRQQAAYLSNWQRGDYPIEVDLGFIDSLKQQLTNKNKSPA